MPVASWTPLHITANDVVFPFNYTAVMTRALVGTPIIGLVAISNALEISAADVVIRDGLGFANFLRPALDHAHAAMNYEALWNFTVLAHSAIRKKTPVHGTNHRLYLTPQRTVAGIRFPPHSGSQ